jgi:hypothetical protein
MAGRVKKAEEYLPGTQVALRLHALADEIARISEDRLVRVSVTYNIVPRVEVEAQIAKNKKTMNRAEPIKSPQDIEFIEPPAREDIRT